MQTKIILSFTCLMISFILFILSLVNVNKDNYKKMELANIIYQVINQKLVYELFDKCNHLLLELFLILSLVINAISIIIIIFKYKEFRKKTNILIHIIAILSVIFDLFVAVGYFDIFYSNIIYGYDNSVKDIVDTKEYNKKDAEILLKNIYNNLSKDSNSKSCLKLYDFKKDNNNKNTYYINMYESCKGIYFPTNAIKLVVNNEYKTKVEKIYWQFNDEIQIPYYENNHKVNDLSYFYNSSLYVDTPHPKIVQKFEEEIKNKIGASNSAKFTYDSFRYSSIENIFLFYGTVENQTLSKEITKNDFVLKILPCKNDNCSDLDYSWQLLDNSSSNDLNTNEYKISSAQKK